ncbi:hypothetical protein B0H11DRAFT_2287344 [Mycena galericulata]|nr:hypothetical protein B0H11DRAFT_2287344 [Mycena galericulata]
MDLSTLPEDVLQYILQFCDVSSVLRFGQVLTAESGVGVDFPGERSAEDRLSIGDIELLSTAALVALVKRLVAGPESWSPAAQTVAKPKMLSRILRKLIRPFSRWWSENLLVHPAQLSARLSLHLPISAETDLLDTEAKLSRGGEFLLMTHSDVLQCWRVDQDTLLWKHHSSVPNAAVVGFEAEIVDNGARANIVIALFNT